MTIDGIFEADAEARVQYQNVQNGLERKSGQEGKAHFIYSVTRSLPDCGVEHTRNLAFHGRRSLHIDRPLGVRQTTRGDQSDHLYL